MAQQQSNGNGANGGGVPINQMAGLPASAGQQMDINVLFQKVLELSEVLKDNREKTQGIVAGAEELAVSSLDLYNVIQLTIYLDTGSCNGSKPRHQRS